MALVDVTGFHLRGIPFHWTENDLRAALKEVGVPGILLVQLMTKMTVLKSGKQLMVTNGDAFMLLNKSDARAFCDDLLLSFHSPVSADRAPIEVRKLDLPDKAQDLQDVILQAVMAGDTMKSEISMEMFLELHNRTLWIREDILRSNFQSYASDNLNEDGSSIQSVTTSPNEAITLWLVLDKQNNDVNVDGLPVQKLLVTQWEGKVPCFKLTDSDKQQSCVIEDELATKAKEGKRKDPLTSESCPTKQVSRELHKEISTHPCKTAATEETRFEPSTNKLLFGGFAKMQEPPIVTVNPEDKPSTLYVQDVAYDINSVELKRVLERQLGGAVALCARFKSKVEVSCKDKEPLILEIPQLEFVLIFKDVITENRCLDKMTFNFKYSPGTNMFRSFIVTRLFSESKTVGVREALSAETSFLEELDQSKILNAKIELDEKAIAANEKLLSQLEQVENLEKNGYKVRVIQKDIPDLQTSIPSSSEEALFIVHEESITLDQDDVKEFKRTHAPAAAPETQNLDLQETSSCCQSLCSMTSTATQPRDEDLPTIPLYVKGVPYFWNCYDLENYFQIQMKSPVTFSAIYSKIVQGKGVHAHENLKIPMGHGIIMFKESAAEAECLKKFRFQPRGLPRYGHNKEMYMRVEVAGENVICNLQTSDVMAGAELRASVMAGMTPSQKSEFLKKYRTEMKNRHELLSDDEKQFNKLTVEEKAKFDKEPQNVLELHTDWWLTQSNQAAT